MSLRRSVPPATWLFAVGVVALGGVTVPADAIARRLTLTDVVTGDVPLDASVVVVSGGLLLVGVVAILYGLVLLVGRR